MSKNSKLIVTAAVCGASTSRRQTPHVPITPEEIAEEVIACADAGASIAHIHVRDDNGVNTIDPERFGRVIELIKSSGRDIVLNLTTACDNVSAEQRMSHLYRFRPEMASLDIGSMNWANHHVFLNEPAFLEKMTAAMKELSVKPEIEIFDAGMIGNAQYYMSKGLIPAPAHFQFVLGVPGGLDATVENLQFLVNKLPEGSTWSALGIGRRSMPMLLATLALEAPCLRVGLEDGVYYSQGVLARSNAQLVARAIRIANEAGREIATPEETRQIMGLTNRPLA